MEMFSVGSTQKYAAEIKGEVYFQIWQNSIFQQFASYCLGKPVAFILVHSVLNVISVIVSRGSQCINGIKKWKGTICNAFLCFVHKTCRKS